MLRVVNERRGITFVEKGHVANTFWTRLKGLMGARSLTPGDGLLILPGNSIHTHFMRFPIDVLYLSADHQVMDVEVAMKPWRIGRPRKGVRCVIELPAGTIAGQNIAIGDRLRITY